MTDQTGPPGTPWSRPDPAPAGEARPGPAPAYGWSGSGQGATPSPAPGGWGPTGWAPPRAPKPGIVPLRPLGLLEILDGAISAIRAHPVAMLGLSAGVVTVSTLVQTIAEYSTLRDLPAVFEPNSLMAEDFDAIVDEITRQASAAVITVVITLVAQIVLTGILTMVVYRAVLGENIPVGAAWRGVRGRVPALLGVPLLTGLVMVLAVVAVSVPAVIAIVLGVPGLAVAIGWLLTAALIVPVVVYVYVAFGVAGPAVVLERRGPVAACRRSRKLVQGSFWRVFGILGLTGIFVVVIAAAIGVPFQVVSALVAGNDPFGVLPLTVQGVGAILAGTLTAPFAAAVVVLLFVDLRIRREGLDIELARAAGVASGGGEGPSGQPPAW